MRDYSAGPEYGRRAARYWFVDGIPDLTFGIALLVWGLTGLLGALYFPGVWMKGLLTAAGIAFLVMFWKDRQIIDAIKSRITYPRTGYVRPPGDPKTIPESEFMSFGMSAENPPKPPEGNVTFFRIRTVLVLWIGSPLVAMVDSRWSLPIVMTILALALWALNRTLERPYGFWAVLPLALAGLVSLFIEFPPRTLQLVPQLIGGVWLIVRGGWTLAHYLRQNPYPRAAVGART